MIIDSLQNPDDQLKVENSSGRLEFTSAENMLSPNYAPTLDTTPVDYKNTPDKIDSAVAGFNTFVNSAMRGVVFGAYKALASDPEYRVFESTKLKAQGEEFISRYGEAFVDSPNEAFTSGMIDKIHEQEVTNQTIAANPVSGFLGALGGGLVDMPTLLIGLGAIKNASTAVNIVTRAAEFGTISAAATAIQKETNATITDSDIFDAGVIGAVLGAAVGGLGSKVTPEHVADLRKSIVGDQEIPNMPEPEWVTEHVQNLKSGSSLSYPVYGDLNPVAAELRDAFLKREFTAAKGDNIMGSIFNAVQYLGSKMSSSARLNRRDAGYSAYLSVRLGGNASTTYGNVAGRASQSFLGHDIRAATTNQIVKINEPLKKWYTVYKKDGGTLSEVEWENKATAFRGGVIDGNEHPTIQRAAYLMKKQDDYYWNRGVEEKLFDIPPSYKKIQDLFESRSTKNMTEDDWLKVVRSDVSKLSDPKGKIYLSPEDQLNYIEAQKYITKIEAGVGRKINVDDIKNPLKLIKRDPNHITHSFDHNKIIDKRLAFRKVIVDQMIETTSLRGEEGLIALENAADEIINNILLKTKNPFDIPNMVFQDKNLVYRQLNLKNEAVLPFLKDSSASIRAEYIKGFETQSIMTKEFGYGNHKENISKRIRESYEQVRSRLSEKDPDYAKKYNKTLEAEKQDIIDSHNLYDIITGGFNKNSGKLGMIARSLAHYNFMRLMGVNILAQIPDVARVLAERVMTPFFNQNAEGIGNLANTVVKFDKESLRLLDIIHDDSIEFGRTQSLGDIYDTPADQMSKVEKYLAKGSKWYGKLTLIDWWNRTARTFAGEHVTLRILKSMRRLKAGKIKQGSLEQIELNKFGYDINNIDAVLEQFDKYSEVVDTIGGKQRIVKLGDWDKVPASLDFISKIRFYVDRVVTEPNPGDKFFWVQKDVGKAVGQFKGFSMASYAKGFTSNIQDLSLNAAYTPVVATRLAAGMTLGYLSYVAGSTLVGRNVDTSPERMFVEGFNRSGVFPMMDMINNVADQYGKGLGGMMGLQGTSKYYNQGLLAPILGPSATLFDTLPQTFGALHNIATGNGTARDWKKLTATAPLQNHFLLKNALTPLGANK